MARQQLLQRHCDCLQFYRRPVQQGQPGGQGNILVGLMQRDRPARQHLVAGSDDAVGYRQIGQQAGLLD
ncbi:hypothetical protein D3C79_558820 [compost metagenome]